MLGISVVGWGASRGTTEKTTITILVKGDGGCCQMMGSGQLEMCFESRSHRESAEKFTRYRQGYWRATGILEASRRNCFKEGG